MGENGFKIIRKYTYILKIKSTYLNALLSFLLSSRFSNHGGKPKKLKLAKKASDRFEKRDDNKKDNKALR